MRSRAVADVRPGDTVLDLYAGVGLFTSFLADAAGPTGQVLSVEADRGGHADARRNLHDRATVRLVADTTERALRHGQLGERADVVVLDPPRTGAKGVVGAIAGLQPRRIVYVACDPAALARDVASLAEHGYSLTGLRAFALFPMTHHVECVAVLERDRTATVSVMRFADPSVCPDCRAPIDGLRCAHCGLDLQDPQVRELWQTLLRADQLLAGAVARRDAATPPPAPTQRPPRRDRSWSVGTVLLAVGAIGLITAAIIFVSRSWDSLGLAGKALVLAAATAAVMAAAGWVTRRPLRSSAEALWAVGLALVALDVVGSRSEGLFNLDEASGGWVAAVAGAALAMIGAAVVRWARPHVGADLVSPAVAAIGAMAVGSVGAAAIGDARAFWHVFVGLVVAGVLGLVLRFSGSVVIAIGSRVVVALWYVAAAGFAVVEAVDHPSVADLSGDLHGLPLLVVSVAAVVVALAVPPLRAVMTAVAVNGLGLLVVIPAADAGGDDGGWLAVAGVAVVLAVVGGRGTTAWFTGTRWGATLPAAGLVGLLIWWVAAVLEVCSRAVDDVGGFSAAQRVQTSARELGVATTIACAAAIVVVAWVISRWPGPSWLRAAGLPAVVATGAISITGIATSARSPWWVLAAVLVLLAAATAALAHRTGARLLMIVAAAAGVAALASSSAVPTVMTATWVLLGLGCLTVAVLSGAPLERQVTAVLAVPLIAVGVGTGVDAADTPWAAVVLSALVVAAVGLFAALRAPAEVRRSLEVGAAAALLVAAGCADSIALAAACWAVVGTVLAAIAMVAADRRWYVGPAMAAFVVAYVLLVIDTGFSFVEAYTLPPAAAALAAGVVLLRRRPVTSSWVALGPGLSLALLPSLPQALAEPTGLRALVLGLGAVLVLAAGLRRGRQAPFLLGAGVAVLVVLFNIGPYANAAPRVVVISIVSALLVGVGITWEDRVRDGRRMLAFVKEMN